MNNQFDNLKNNEIDPNTEYFVTEFTKSKRFTILMKYAILGQYKFIENYFNALKHIGESRLIDHVINQQNERGWTPLMLACRYASKYSNLQTIKLLLANGARTNFQNDSGETALMMAAEYSNTESNIETVQLLLDHGVDVDEQTYHGYTALYCASSKANTTSNIETVKLLLDYNADPNLQDCYGDTALTHASAYMSGDDKNIEIVKLLLDYKADPNLCDRDGDTPLILIAKYKYNDNRNGNHIKIAKLLLDHGANVNMRNNKEKVALAYAVNIPKVIRNNIGIIRLLLEYKTDVNLVISDKINVNDIIQLLL